MELKGKHIYGLGAAVAGVVALVFAALYWFVNQKVDSYVQAGLALGLIGFALFAWLEIDLITHFLKSRQARYGAETLVFTAMFLAILVLVNWIFTRPALQKDWDLTETKQNTLSPETLKVLSELKEPVKVLGFYTSQAAYSQDSAKELLENYREHADGQFDYDFVDPLSQPTIAQEYGVTKDNTLLVTRGEQRESVTFADEQSLTNAIVRINNPVSRTVYFVSGHGEKSVDDSDNAGLSQIKTLLGGINYQVKTLDVIGGGIPVDASAIVIAGPTRPYSDAEVSTIAKYLNGGGKAVFMLEPSVIAGIEAGQTDPLVAYLNQNWGLTLRDDLIIDQRQSIADLGPTAPATISYGASPITQDLASVISFFPSSRSIVTAEAGATPEGVTITSVITTGPDAWGETDFAALNENVAQPDPQDATGELILAASAENTATNTRVVVFGDSDFGANVFWQSGAANGTLLLNAIKWTTTEEDLISMTPKDTVTRYLNVYTARDLAIVFLLACVLPPFVVIALAVSVWWSRRRSGA